MKFMIMMRRRVGCWLKRRKLKMMKEEAKDKKARILNFCLSLESINLIVYN